ncbi:hypothetical protein ACLB2K_004359 [Fragaria x ananassa]
MDRRRESPWRICFKTFAASLLVKSADLSMFNRYRVFDFSPAIDGIRCSSQKTYQERSFASIYGGGWRVLRSVFIFQRERVRQLGVQIERVRVRLLERIERENS